MIKKLRSFTQNTYNVGIGSVLHSVNNHIMNMRGILTHCFLLIMLGLPLASCGDDDNDKDPSEPEVVTAMVEYTIPDRYDLLKYVDMTVYYTNNEGKEVQEAVTSTTWKKSLTKVSVPSMCQIKVVYARNNTPLEQESYKFGTGLTISYTTSSGKLESIGSSGFISVSKSKVEEYLKKVAEEKVSLEITK